MRLYKKEKQGNLRKITFLGKTFTYTKKARVPLHINRAKVEKKIVAFDEIGINTDKRKQKLIVSLTSFPPRMSDIHYTLYSLLNQSIKPDEVILWLAKEQFPNREADIPQKVLDLQKNGLTIKWCDDWRSYKKLVPSLLEYPDDIIVTADDDVFYPQNWLKKLYLQHQKYPKNIICHRCHRVTWDKDGNMLTYSKWPHNVTRLTPSFANFATGVGGILYPPHIMHRDVTNIERFKMLAPYADDIWFWAMEVLGGAKVKTFWNRMRKIRLINAEREMRENSEQILTQINIAQGGNDKQLKAVLDYYPQIWEKLRNE